ncbi:colicin E1 family microcin immunity protein [Pseudomonas sp. EA_65y_Pfl1_P113]|uniref:colicin E1 family microcin immunity protein n=1 Tax=Pseudomonas sp. EA_65y_Pfl1_P113 TaxID=3088692 RepID=UPI00351A49A0
MLTSEKVMDRKYYLYNFFWGALIFFLAVYDFEQHSFRFSNEILIHPITLFINALLFPFSKCLVENIALRYTTKEFWETNALRTAAYNGGLILYCLFCFVFAIPLGIICMAILCIKRRRP